MCGIFGYIGSKDPINMTIEGLKRLEYRGYDSAGIAGLKNGNIVYCKEVGKISILEKEIKNSDIHLDFAIGQTRWATHGKVSKTNAHPHFDEKMTLALVHNGIIENHATLRNELKDKGIQFVSDTDTEVIAQLIGLYYQGDLLKAVRETVSRLQGSYAVALIHRDCPGQIIAIAHDCPLVIGIGNNEVFLSSDPHAFAFYTRQAIYLSNSEIAVIRSNSQQIYNAEEEIVKQSQELGDYLHSASKGDFEHYTLKEIHEQPQTIRNALLSRFLLDYGTAIFEELDMTNIDLLNVERILILACGTSWHAGYVASYMIEDLARIPVQVEISSEFRYKNPLISPGTFVIAISQSGETADTIAAVREVKAKGAKVIALCNVQGSTLVREADSTIFLKAGAEIGVCSTKAYTSQVVVLALFTLMMARMRHMGKAEGQEFLRHLLELPDQVQKVLDQSDRLASLADCYSDYENFFFVGRRYMYPTALEGALKLKEISYINANGYPAGEIKHGPIALINELCPTVALCGNRMTYEKLLSNLMEIKARNGKILAIAEEGEKHIEQVADHVFYIPRTCDELSTVLTAVAIQLFSYHVAKKKGADIDHPRNLAKSVTVE